MDQGHFEHQNHSKPIDILWESMGKPTFSQPESCVSFVKLTLGEENQLLPLSKYVEEDPQAAKPGCPVMALGLDSQDPSGINWQWLKIRVPNAPQEWLYH